MILKPRPGPYRLHGLGSPEGEVVLAEQGLTCADLDRALAELGRVPKGSTARFLQDGTLPD